MKKILIIIFSFLGLANISNLSAYSWTIMNGLNKRICITLNASNQKMRKSIESGKEATFAFTDWRKGLCLTAIAVKEYKEGCPQGLKNIGTSDLFNIAKSDYDALKTAVLLAYKTGSSKEEKTKQDNALKAAIQAAIKKAVSVPGKLCKDGSFILVEDGGKIYAITPK